MCDFSALFKDFDLATRFIVDRLLDETHRVHVFDFTAGAEVAEVLRRHVFFMLTCAADRYVDIGAQVSVLHVAIACAEVAQNLTQLDDIGSGLFWAANIWTRDDFHQRNACAVEIDERHVRVHVVDRFASVLFKVNALDAYETGHTRGHIHKDLAFTDDGLIELADLIALRQIRVEIVFAVKR